MMANFYLATAGSLVQFLLLGLDWGVGHPHVEVEVQLFTVVNRGFHPTRVG
jgi:hypothetical protein